MHLLASRAPRSAIRSSDGSDSDKMPETMDGSPPPLHTRVVRLGLDVANGRHPLSRFVAPLLLLFDAVLCALVIWRVPCRPTRVSIHTPARRPPFRSGRIEIYESNMGLLQTPRSTGWHTWSRSSSSSTGRGTTRASRAARARSCTPPRTSTLTRRSTMRPTMGRTSYARR